MAAAALVTPSSTLKLQYAAGCPQLFRLRTVCFRSNSRSPAVRCRASKDENPTPPKAPQDELSPVGATPAKPVETMPKATEQASTSFWDLFAFSGPVPETVNGRLAMLGFTAALAMELASGQDLFGQIENGGVSWFTAAALLFTLASVIPLSRGVSVDKASGGIGGVFSSKAERWNGRAAMLGLVALAITEFVKGTPLI